MYNIIVESVCVKLDCFGGLLKYNIIVECVCETGLFSGVTEV
jgi:hypothetical protein